MFDIQLAKTAKSLSIAAALLALPTSAAFAQGAYGVLVNVQTLGMPGGSTNYSNGLPLATSEFRESDPAGGNWGNKPSNTVFADGAARGWAEQGALKVATDATTDRLAATDFPNSYPYGFAEVRYWDTATVKSATLAAGTPVTLVFRTDLSAAIDGTDLFAGVFYGEQVVAGKSVALQQQFGYTDMDYSTDLGLITVNTKVGARFTMSGRLYLHTRAHYYAIVDGVRRYDGHASGEAVLASVLESASADAYLEADSGKVYEPAGN